MVNARKAPDHANVLVRQKCDPHGHESKQSLARAWVERGTFLLSTKTPCGQCHISAFFRKATFVKAQGLDRHPSADPFWL